MRQTILASIFLIMLAAVASCSPGIGRVDEPSGGGAVLFGTLMIGPVCPVETQGEGCIPSPDVYESRDIIIKDMQGEVVRTADIGADGTYRVELEPGTYVVDITRGASDSSPDIPTQVTLAQGSENQLDIGIDTGIR
jgi:hypothetical protein